MSALRLPVIDQTFHNDIDIVNAPAADPDGHARSGLQPRSEIGTGKLFTYFTGDVFDGAARKALADEQKRG
jgi:hypothetical protein